MGLYEKIAGFEFPRIRLHALRDAVEEFERGKITQQQVFDLFGLSAGEQTELTTLFGKIVPPRETIALGGFVIMTNIGTTYRVLAGCRIECAGITAFEYAARVTKIGTGTQSWQLWDETNGAEIAVFDDAGAATEKNLGPTTVNVGPLAAGVRTIFVRGKSTVAADDPVFQGATLLIRRVGLMTAEVFEHVAELADYCRRQNLPPLNTVALLKTRLGV